MELEKTKLKKIIIEAMTFTFFITFSPFTVYFNAFKFIFKNLGFFFTAWRKKKVCNDSENQCAGNCSDFDFAEFYDHAADTCDKNYARYEEVAVFVQINLLEHFET